MVTPLHKTATQNPQSINFDAVIHDNVFFNVQTDFADACTLLYTGTHLFSLMYKCFLLLGR